MVTPVIDFTKNAWVTRYAKFLIALAFALIEIANVWANGPDWLYVAAPVVASILVAVTGNAPLYKDPRANHMRATRT